MVTQCWRLGVQSERQTAGSCEVHAQVVKIM